MEIRCFRKKKWIIDKSHYYESHLQLPSFSSNHGEAGAEESEESRNPVEKAGEAHNKVVVEALLGWVSPVGEEQSPVDGLSQGVGGDRVGLLGQDPRLRQARNVVRAHRLRYAQELAYLEPPLQPFLHR